MAVNVFPPPSRVKSQPEPLPGPWEKEWEVVRALSGGGQGDTLLVRQRSDGSEAVLKRLKTEKRSDLKARARMHKEVTALQTLAPLGAKVPKYLDGNTASFSDNDGDLYFVMERIEGQTLDSLLKKTGPLTLDQAIDLSLDLCRTLAIAFKAEVSHRDIKPENLIVRGLNPPNVVMLDFGLSFNKRDEKEVTEFGEALDNKFLSLPERRGPYENKRNPVSDLTSVVGVLLYCLTGVSPRNLRDSEGRTPNRSDGVKFATVTEERALEFLHAFFDRGLQNDIRRRFQTVEELEARLSELKSGNFGSPVEDFDEASSIIVEDLLRKDRVSRHHVLRSALGPLQQALEQTPYGITMPPFQLGLLGSMRQNVRGAKFPKNEFWNFALLLSVPKRKTQFVIDFVAVENEPECEIFLRLSLQSGQGSVEQMSERRLSRYIPPAVPKVADVASQIKPAVLEAMRLFVKHVEVE